MVLQINIMMSLRRWGTCMLYITFRFSGPILTIVLSDNVYIHYGEDRMLTLLHKMSPLHFCKICWVNRSEVGTWQGYVTDVTEDIERRRRSHLMC